MPKSILLTMPQNNSENYRIIRNPRRKRIALRIAPDGVLEILAPPEVPESFLARIPTAERTAIIRLRQQTQALQRPALSFDENSRFALLGKFYPLKQTARLYCFDGERFLIPRGSDDEMKTKLISLYQEMAKKYIFKRCTELQSYCNLHPDNLRLSSADTRWGSCNSKRTISFSWKLIQCPPELIDYVIIHELAHLKELNHSPKFWRIVASFCPDHQLRKNQLKAFSRQLPPL